MKRFGFPWLLAGVVLLLVAACDVPQPVPGAVTPGRLLWIGDMETGDLSQFQDTPWDLVGATPPAVVGQPVRDGRFSLSVAIPSTSSPTDGICCGSRNELTPVFRDFTPGDDLYFGFSSYLQPGFPVDAAWQVMVQFKQTFDGSPPLGLYVERGEYRLEGGVDDPRGPQPFTVPLGPAVPARWVDWTLHVVFSPDPRAGRVDVWRDDAAVVTGYAPRSGTMYVGPDGRAADTLKIGYYRSPAIAVPGTIVYDDWRIGTSRAVVQRDFPAGGNAAAAGPESNPG